MIEEISYKLLIIPMSFNTLLTILILQLKSTILSYFLKYLWMLIKLHRDAAFDYLLSVHVLYVCNYCHVTLLNLFILQAWKITPRSGAWLCHYVICYKWCKTYYYGREYVCVKFLIHVLVMLTPIDQKEFKTKVWAGSFQTLFKQRNLKEMNFRTWDS